MKTHLLWLLPFLLSACQPAENKTGDFPEIQHITCYDSIYSDRDNPLGTIRGMKIADETIILLTSGNEYAFSLIDTHSGKLKAQWGKTGRGPGEYLSIGPGFTMHDQKLVFVDAMKNELNEVPLNVIAEGRDVEPVRTPYPYTAAFRSQYVVPVGNRKIVLGALAEGRFGVLDSANRIVECPFDYPFTTPIEGIFRGTVYQSQIEKNEKLDRFVIMLLTSGIFEIYEVAQNKVERVYLHSSSQIPQLKEKPRSGNRYTIDYEQSAAGFMKMAVSDELICFTHSSRPYSVEAQEGKYATEIQGFDWDGNRVVKYVLPFAINNFCLDDTYIYGTAQRDGHIVLYRFPIEG